MTNEEIISLQNTIAANNAALAKTLTTPTHIQSKQNRLQQRTAEKTAKLGYDITNYADTNFTGQHVVHDTTMNTTGVHDFNNQQEVFGALIADEQIYIGNTLTLQDLAASDNPNQAINPNGKYKAIHKLGSNGESTGFTFEELPTDKWGGYGTRNLYARNVGDNLSKVGLARNDLTEEAKAINPNPSYWRYADKTHFNPYSSTYKEDGKQVNNPDGTIKLGYDGTPGPAVPHAGDPLLDVELDGNAATKFELNRYMDRATIAARAMGTGAASEINYSKFGGGANEYTNTNADPLFNDAVQTTGIELPAGTHTPVYGKGYNKQGQQLASVSSEITQEDIDALKAIDAGPLSSITGSDIVDGVSSIATTAASLVPGLADVAIEAGLWVNHKLGDPAELEKLSDEELKGSNAGWLLGLKKAKDGTLKSTVFDNGKEVLDAYAGINTDRRDTAQAAIVDEAYNIYKNDDMTVAEKVSALGSTLGNNLSVLPDTLGAVFGFMVTMGVGGGTKLAAVSNEGKIAKVADFLGIADGANVATRVAQATKKSGLATKSAGWLEKNPKAVAKLDKTIAKLEKRFDGDKVAITGKGLGLMPVTTNEMLEARHENNEDDGSDNYASLFEVVTTGITAYGMNSIDLITDKFALSPHASKLITGTAKLFAKKVAKAETKSAAKKFLLNSLKFTATAAGKIGESVVVEGSTEGLQQAIQVFAERWGTDTFKDKEFTELYDNKAIKEIIGSTVMGAFAGGALKGGAVAVEPVKKELTRGPTSKDKPDATKDTSEPVEGLDDTLNEASEGTTDSTDTTADKSKVDRFDKDYVASDEDIEEVKKGNADIVSRIKSGGAVTQDDLDKIHEYKAIVGAHPEKGKRDAAVAHMENLADQVRASVIKAAEDNANLDEYTEDKLSKVYGSESAKKQKYLEDILDLELDENAKDATEKEKVRAKNTNKKLRKAASKIADKFGVKIEDIKRDTSAVSKEMISGRNGYKSHDARVRTLLNDDNPSLVKIKKAINGIGRFKNANGIFIKNAEEAINNVSNSSDVLTENSITFEYPSGNKEQKDFVIHLKNGKVPKDHVVYKYINERKKVNTELQKTLERVQKVKKFKKLISDDLAGLGEDSKVVGGETASTLGYVVLHGKSGGSKSYKTAKQALINKHEANGIITNKHGKNGFNKDGIFHADEDKVNKTNYTEDDITIVSPYIGDLDLSKKVVRTKLVGELVKQIKKARGGKKIILDLPISKKVNGSSLLHKELKSAIMFNSMWLPLTKKGSKATQTDVFMKKAHAKAYNAELTKEREVVKATEKAKLTRRLNAAIGDKDAFNEIFEEFKTSDTTGASDKEIEERVQKYVNNALQEIVNELFIGKDSAIDVYREATTINDKGTARYNSAKTALKASAKNLVGDSISNPKKVVEAITERAITQFNTEEAAKVEVAEILEDIKDILQGRTLQDLELEAATGENSAVEDLADIEKIFGDKGKFISKGILASKEFKFPGKKSEGGRVALDKKHIYRTVGTDGKGKVFDKPAITLRNALMNFGVTSEVANDIIKNKQISTSKALEEAGITDGAIIAMPIDPADYTIVEDTSKKLIGMFKVEHMGAEAVKYIREFKESLGKVLAKDMFKGKDAVNAQWQAVLEHPARAILFNEDGSLNDNAVMAGKLAIDEFVSYDAAMLSNTPKDPAMLARVTGLSEMQISGKLSNLIGSKGMFKKTLANKVGKIALSHLGIKADKTVYDTQMFARLAADYGNAMIHGYVKQGILKRGSVNAGAYGRAIKDTSNTKDSKAVIDFVSFKVDSTEDIYETYEDETTIKEDVVEAFESMEDLLGPVATMRKGPKHTAPKNSKHAKKVKGSKSGTVPSEKAEKITQTLREYKWHFNIKLAKKILKDMVKVEDGEDITEEVLANSTLAKTLEYKDQDAMEQMSYYDAEGQISKNRDILKSIEEVYHLIDAIEDEDNILKADELYFDWFYSKNGRYMMDSNTFNPQTDKFHRFLAAPEELNIAFTIDKDGKILDNNGESYEAEFNYSLAQAFGVGVDKKPTRMTEAVGLTLRNKSKKQLKVIKEALLEDGEYILVFDKPLVFNKGIKDKEFMLKNTALEVEHLSHLLLAIDTLENIQDNKGTPGKTMYTMLSAETDAITSGFGLKLLQMPIISNVYKYLMKVGIITKKGMEESNIQFALQDHENMNDVLSAEGMYDSYQTLAKDSKIPEAGDIESMTESYLSTMSVFHGKKADVEFAPTTWEHIRAVLPNGLKDDEAVSSAMRTLFKDPFMTFNYASSMKSIRRSLSAIMVNDIVNKMIKSEEGDPAYALLVELAAGEDIDVFKDLLKTEPLYSIKLGDSNVEEVISSYVNASYGQAVEDVMEVAFSEFTEANSYVNESFRALFYIFNYKYQQELTKARQDSGVMHVTAEKKLEIINKLRKVFPMVASPLASENDQLNSGIDIIDTKNVTAGGENAFEAPATYLEGSVATNKVNHEIKAFEKAIAAGAVIPTHYIDASSIGLAILSGEGGQFVSIHDAKIPSMFKLRDSSKVYNEDVLSISETYSIIEKLNDQVERAFKEVEEETANLKEYYPDSNFHYVSYTNGDGKEGSPQRVKVTGEEAPKDVSWSDYAKAVRKNLSNLAENVKAKRKELFTLLDEGYISGHMAGVGKEGMATNGTIDKGLEPIVFRKIEDHEVPKKKKVKKVKKDKTKVTEKNFDIMEILGATDAYLPDVNLTPKQLNDITMYNDNYFKNSKTKLVMSDKFEFDDKTDTIYAQPISEDVDEEMHQVYLNHEITHALTYEWLSNNTNHKDFVYIKNALTKAFKEFDPSTTTEDFVLYDRLRYANKGLDSVRRVAEIVAILSSEPNVRARFMEVFPQAKTKSTLERILNSIKKFLGLTDGIDNLISTIDNVVAEQEIIKLTPDEEFTNSLEEVDIVGKDLGMYHGFYGSKDKYLDKDGNLVLKPVKNFNGKTESVSFTHSFDTASRYATQIKGGGPTGFRFAEANIIKIKPNILQDLVRESQEEFAVNTTAPIVIPKGSFEVIPHKFALKLKALEDEYSLEEFLTDNLDSIEREQIDTSEKFSQYLDFYIAEHDTELADDIYKEMKYLRNGDYNDLKKSSATMSSNKISKDLSPEALKAAEAILNNCK